MGTGWSFIKPGRLPELASSRRMAMWPQADARQKLPTSSFTIESKLRRITGAKDWASR
jgi:hypothetical protein